MQKPCLFDYWGLESNPSVNYYSEFLRYPMRQSPTLGTESPCKADETEVQLVILP
jgi:hypothetical protein